MCRTAPYAHAHAAVPVDSLVKVRSVTHLLWAISVQSSCIRPFLLRSLFQTSTAVIPFVSASRFAAKEISTCGGRDTHGGWASAWSGGNGGVRRQRTPDQRAGRPGPRRTSVNHGGSGSLPSNDFDRGWTGLPSPAVGVSSGSTAGFGRSRLIRLFCAF